VSGQTMAGTGPAACSGQSGIPVLVAVDTSGHVWYNNSGTWDSLGGSATSSPAAANRNNLTNAGLTVFVRGTNGSIYYRDYVQGRGWSPWTCIGGQTRAGDAPAVCSWGAGRLDVFVEGMNGALYHKWYSGVTWSGWQSLGGQLTASPAAAAASSANTTQISVFVRGTDSACWEKSWTGTAWSSWHSFGGQLAPNTGPAVGPLNILYVQGTNHQLWYQWLNGTKWSGWSSLAACPEVLSASSPAAVWSYDGHPLVYVSSTSGNILGCYLSADWNGTAWVTVWSWFSVSSPP
jgi:hypothetical protein